MNTHILYTIAHIISITTLIVIYLIHLRITTRKITELKHEINAIKFDNRMLWRIASHNLIAKKLKEKGENNA